LPQGALGLFPIPWLGIFGGSLLVEGWVFPKIIPLKGFSAIFSLNFGPFFPTLLGFFPLGSLYFIGEEGRNALGVIIPNLGGFTIPFLYPIPF